VRLCGQRRYLAQRVWTVHLMGRGIHLGQSLSQPPGTTTSRWPTYPISQAIRAPIMPLFSVMFDRKERSGVVEPFQHVDGAHANLRDGIAALDDKYGGQTDPPDPLSAVQKIGTIEVEEADWVVLVCVHTQ
jgi:hypothetical protein